MKCPSCDVSAASGHKSCPACGQMLISHLTPTLSHTSDSPRLAYDARAPNDDLAPARIQSRFVPGTVLAQRYRIVSPVGTGGMGEIYRAEDLRLGQTVALKFLPAFVTNNESARARLNHEVSIARHVSHPNVCRVFDIGDAEAGPFITMEFVDGEDLGTLRRRIGKLPLDKGIDVAQQLCAGLAAAHALGVLHRDLKPANVMLDGRGKIRITDFGLAGVVGQFRQEDLGQGTPAYMAPEQMLRQEVSAQTDIYGLGLVLYEVFTGQQATATVPDPRLDSSALVKPSALIKGFDSAIERIILRCLQTEPALRPKSVLEISAALPGGDPLRAAVAAGETPSPETVAASGAPVVISASRGFALLCSVLLSTVIAVLLWQRANILGANPGGKAPDVLSERAQEIVATLGYSATPADTAWWLDTEPEFRGDSAFGRGLQFFYRQSPTSMSPRSLYGTVSLDDPSPTQPGMITVVLDSRGRLIQFVAIPSGKETSQAAAPLNGDETLQAAGLDPAKSTSSGANWIPATAFDARRDFTAQEFGSTLAVTAAAFHGKLVYFRAAAPSAPAAPPAPSRGDLIGSTAFVVVVAVVLLGGIFLARRNLRRGRGDRKGAFLIAAFIFFNEFLEWLVSAHHVSNFDDEYGSFIGGCGQALYVAIFMWILYMAIEPYLRRRWPEMLISWTRILSGTIRDTRVGRDVLMGALGGSLIGIVFSLAIVAPSWVHIGDFVPAYVARFGMRGPIAMLALLCRHLSISVQWALATAALVLVVRIIVRSDKLAMIVTILVLSLVIMPETKLVVAVIAGLFATVIGVTLLFRYGLLALVILLFFSWLLRRWPITFNFSEWYFGRSLFGLLLLAAISIFGFYAATGGQSLFGEKALDE